MSDNKKKRNKYRQNVAKFVDADYKNKLSDDELAWYESFENEYYANAVGKDGVFKANLDEERYEEVKLEIYNQTNAQNRDLYAIAGTSSNYLKFIDDDGCFIEPVAGTSSINKIADPEYAFTIFLEQTIDELQSDTSRDLETVLTEYAIELVKLGASLRKDKVNSALRRKKVLKENKDEE